MILKADCRHFPGDRPCAFSKADGRRCTDCPDYARGQPRILLIKLDALGDVLRTTALLPSLKKAWPDASLTWLTRANARPLLRFLPAIDRLWSAEDPLTLARLGSERFDLCIHPDASPDSAALATVARATETRGYTLAEDGSLVASNEAAQHWLEMGAFDTVKKANTRSYQEHLHAIAGLPWEGGAIGLALRPEERARARDFAARHGLTGAPRVLGLNTGASPRWPLKKWTVEGYVGLIERVVAETDWPILLYGGPGERERNARLAAVDARVIDTGADNDLRSFCALLELCDVLVTGDTLALHAATALGKRVVCLFGPTSAAEIATYGRITRLQPALDCLVCYKTACDFAPNCMESLDVEQVYAAVREAADAA